VIEAGGWGWHSETAVHLLRMVLSGALDRHPRLRLIIGHMGEMLPVMLGRIDEAFALDIDHLERPIGRAILDQVWITTSGIFSEPPFLAALLTFGIDRSPCQGPRLPRPPLHRPGRHGQAHTWQCRCPAEAEGGDGA
jgi:hypothetical protein